MFLVNTVMVFILVLFWRCFGMIGAAGQNLTNR